MPTVLITGASRGLGANAALHLAAKGFDVIGTYASAADKAEEVAAEIRAKGRKVAMLKLDTGKASQFESFAGQVKTVLMGWGAQGLDGLVNNAGFGAGASIAETTEAQLDTLFAVHVKGPFLLTGKLLPLINKGGSIVNLSSGLARFSYPGYAAYASMKGAVEVMTRYMATEFGPLGIRVNTLAPGAIETDFGGGAVRDNAALNEMIAQQTPLGRVGLPDDIGKAIALLVSEESGWISGQRIEASGAIHS
jgi:NAD(P)-dependent dehydrogenase (short-subunit alcohol dehydrogenase family)